jgi:hypothetical protein
MTERPNFVLIRLSMEVAVPQESEFLEGEAIPHTDLDGVRAAVVNEALACWESAGCTAHVTRARAERVWADRPPWLVPV